LLVRFDDQQAEPKFATLFYSSKIELSNHAEFS